MEESRAPEAERLYREAVRRRGDEVDAYVEVRVLDGLGVIRSSLPALLV
jgi:hypothetical protein